MIKLLHTAENSLTKATKCDTELKSSIQEVIHQAGYMVAGHA